MYVMQNHAKQNHVPVKASFRGQVQTHLFRLAFG